MPDYEGFFSVWRKLRKHDYAKDKPYNKLAAWIDLIARASYRDEEVIYRGKTYKLKRGELIISPRRLAMDWGWSRQKVVTFLENAIKDGEVSQQVSQQVSQLTILKYDNYQKSQPSKQPTRQASEPFTPIISKKKYKEKDCMPGAVKTASGQNSPQTLFQIPLKGKNLPTFSVTPGLVGELKEYYPGLDIEQSLRSCAGWNKANPTKRKTARGIMGHINYWLSRDNDRGKFRITAGPGNINDPFRCRHCGLSASVLIDGLCQTCTDKNSG